MGPPPSRARVGPPSVKGPATVEQVGRLTFALAGRIGVMALTGVTKSTGNQRWSPLVQSHTMRGMLNKVDSVREP